MNDAPTWVITIVVVAALSVVFGLAAFGLAAIDTWRGRRRERLGFCVFCGRTAAAVDELIAGPGVAICDRCARACVEQLAEHLRGEHDHRGTESQVDATCSFCGLRRAELRVLITSFEHAICDECIGTCRHILAGDAIAADAARGPGSAD